MRLATRLLRVLRGPSRVRANKLARKHRRRLVIEGLERREVFAAFTPGNLVVNRIGTGAAALSSAAWPISLVEFNISGTNQNNVISLPSFSSGGNNQGGFTDSGTATSNGFLNRSSDGQFLSLIGIDAQVGTASVTGTTAAVANRNVANVTSSGLVTIEAKLTDAFTTNNARGAVSTNGDNIWVVGTGTAPTDGVRYVNAASGTPTTSTQIAAGNLRNAAIFGGVLFTSNTTSISSYAAPSAPPTSLTAGSPLTFTTGGVASGSGAFFFFDRDAATTATNLNGLDTLYVVDGPAIEKYEWTGSGWTQRGSATYSTTLFGLTAAVSAGNIDLYATTVLGSNNALIKISDNSGFGASLSGVAANFTVLANAGNNFAFRGVAFAPVTPDTTPPTISSLSPADNASDAPIGGNLVATFNENIAKGTGNILIKKTSDDSTVFSIDVTSAQVTVSGALLTVDPPADLDSSTGYYIQIPNTAVRDTAGNFFAGINDSTTWNFTTIAAGDTTPPTVSGLNPADDATNVALTSDLVVTFSEDVVKDSGNILVKKTSDDSIVHTIDVASGLVTISGAVVTINPATDFAFNTGYYVEIPATAFKDPSNNFFAGISNKNTWNFTTVPDTIPPTVVSIDDGDPNNFVQPNIALTYTITFSEDIDETTVTGADFDNDGSSSITIGTVTETSPGVFTVQVTPTSEGTLRLRIPTGAVIKDIAGNDLVVPVSDSDTLTVDGTVPTVNSIVDNVSGNPIFQGQIVTYTLTFSEDIDHTTVSAIDFANAGTATVTFGTFTETSPGTVTLRATTTSAGTLRLRLPADADIRDLAGNKVTVPVDDDTEITVNASTSNLTAGDVAVIGYNTNGATNDSFVIVTLRTLPAGTVFYVNDNEIAADGGGSFTNLDEFEASFTVKAGQSIAAGTVISLPWGSGAVDATEYVWSSTSSAGFGNNNEEIYVYSASSITDTTPTAFIYGVAIGSSASSRANGLTLGTTFIKPTGSVARYKTSGATYSGSPHQLRTAIGDTTSNWEGVAPGNAGDWTFTVQAPTLSSVTLNTADGFSNPNQRSMITSLVVTFSAPVTLAADAFTIRNIGLFNASNIPLTAGQILVTPNASNDVYTIRFGAGTSVNSRSGSGNRGNSLADGNYRLEIDRTKVTNGGGGLTGSNVFGAEAADRFFRMYGDSNGDGRVDGTDFAVLRAALAGAYNPAFDFDGNGSVSSGLDTTEYTKRQNRRRRTW